MSRRADSRRPAVDGPLLDGPALVLGLGVTGRAVAAALVRRGHDVVLVDDEPGPEARAAAHDLDVELAEAPGPHRWAELIGRVAGVVPSPGVPSHHPVFAAASAARVPVIGELDLAAEWDDRPCVAITGTDGKTTVTTLVTSMLIASGVRAVDAGNTDVPLVAAIDDPGTEVFVVEASSFRLAPLRRFRPRVGTWLNFAPDHLDAHATLADYEAAKAVLWARLAGTDLAVANADDTVVMGHAVWLTRLETFGLADVDGANGADWHVADGALRTPDGGPIVAVDELHRGLPHDLANALAAAATATGAGATPEGVRTALRAFRGLPHRVTLVSDADGVRWYDDSKATAPHATMAALAGFESVVLIAGGLNKGLDLGVLAAMSPRIRAVVAIGAAAPEVAAAFAGHRPVRHADSMDDAVAAAGALARPGDVVLLSPGCASFDWYRSYRERGDDFARAVREQVGTEA
ncbi:MAG: UDP-N-acetylmuramoyl-L-alanine--D-glutamate ligase [Acidimicrobiales bacterium]